jgi:nitrite reductase/ring-hydroxylating ferredoxin subunit
MNARIAFLLPTALLLLSLGCKKDEPSGVPLTAVDISINVNLPEYNGLAAIGGWVYLTGGSEGLIVYRKDVDNFVAMDRHCPVNPEDLCKVTVDGDGILAVDTACCECSFLLQNGTLVSNPNNADGAGGGLKLYNTTFNGTVLHIFN